MSLASQNLVPGEEKHFAWYVTEVGDEVEIYSQLWVKCLRLIIYLGFSSLVLFMLFMNTKSNISFPLYLGMLVFLWAILPALTSEILSIFFNKPLLVLNYEGITLIYPNQFYLPYKIKYQSSRCNETVIPWKWLVDVSSFVVSHGSRALLFKYDENSRDNQLNYYLKYWDPPTPTIIDIINNYRKKIGKLGKGNWE
jgi:hypothetical protein